MEYRCHISQRLHEQQLQTLDRSCLTKSTANGVRVKEERERPRRGRTKWWPACAVTAIALAFAVIILLLTLYLEGRQYKLIFIGSLEQFSSGDQRSASMCSYAANEQIPHGFELQTPMPNEFALGTLHLTINTL